MMISQIPRVTLSPTSGTAPTVSQSLRSTNFANWILYRLTDIMLMKAEAEIELGSTEQLDDAFELISAVYNRANNLNATVIVTYLYGVILANSLAVILFRM